MLDTGRARLYTAHKTLREKWETAKLHWQDSVRKDFEEHQLDPLEPRLAHLLTAIDRLAQVLNQVNNDCRE